MKKTFILVAAMACTLASYAADIWTGTHAVSWDNTIKIEADKFADAKVGDKLTLAFVATDGGDVIELKSDGDKLPGTRFYPFGADATSMETYITADMLHVLQATGLEVCGTKFTVSTIKVENVGYEMPEGAIWAGNFWCDNWKTLELWKTAFDTYANQRYLVVNLSKEEYAYDYDLNIISTWEQGAFADWQNTTKEQTRVILDTQVLEGGLLAAIEGNDRVMFQGNCQVEGKGFNITSIVLTNSLSGEITTINESVVETANDGRIYTIMGQEVSEPTQGIYIRNGKKIVVF